MKKVTIDFADYCDETNDSREIKTCKAEGPRYQDEDGYFRVPRTGFVRNGVEYQLRGFGKLDKRPGPKIEITDEATHWFEMRLGPGYVPHFIRNRDLRVRVSTAIKLMGWPALLANIERAAQEMPIIKAIEAATSYVPPRPAEEPYDTPPDGGIDAGDLEDMFK